MNCAIMYTKSEYHSSKLYVLESICMSFLINLLFHLFQIQFIDSLLKIKGFNNPGGKRQVLTFGNANGDGADFQAYH